MEVDIEKAVTGRVWIVIMHVVSVQVLSATLTKLLVLW